MPLHPDLEGFLELVQAGAAAGRRPLHELPIAAARLDYEQSAQLLDTSHEAVERIDTLAIPCRDGQHIHARLYRPAHPAPRQPVLLYCHGGGYCVGSLDSHDGLCRALARRTPCAVLALAYRLAPEHPFPTAFDDTEDAYRWLCRSAPGLGLDPACIAVGGDSVGATLVTALTLALRGTDAPQPRLQVLIYPCTSARQDSSSQRRYAQGHLLEAATLQWMFGHYLRSDADRDDWRFAPLEAAELGGLPGAFVALAEHDLLVDEGIAYAERLGRAGTPTALKVYAGMVHDFARLTSLVAAAEQVRDDIARALAAAFR